MDGVQLGKERLTGELETLTRMDDTVVAVFDERHHSAGLVRNKNYATSWLFTKRGGVEFRTTKDKTRT